MAVLPAGHPFELRFHIRVRGIWPLTSTVYPGAGYAMMSPFSRHRNSKSAKPKAPITDVYSVKINLQPKKTDLNKYIDRSYIDKAVAALGKE